MALSLRPLTESFSLVWQHDPAVKRPVRAPGTTEDAWKLQLDDFDAVWMRCLETLDFAPVLREDVAPTVFVFRPLRGVALAEYHSMALSSGRPEFLENAMIVFRAQLQGIENWSGFPKLEHVIDHEKPPTMRKLLAPQLMDLLDVAGAALGRYNNAIAIELGIQVVNRTVLSPK